MRRPTGDQEVAGLTPSRGRQHSFVEIDHEIFSMVILSLPLIQEGQLSVSIFYGHSLPSADSRRAVVSFWRKNVHNTG